MRPRRSFVVSDTVLIGAIAAHVPAAIKVSPFARKANGSPRWLRGCGFLQIRFGGDLLLSLVGVGHSLCPRRARLIFNWYVGSPSGGTAVYLLFTTCHGTLLGMFGRPMDDVPSIYLI